MQSQTSRTTGNNNDLSTQVKDGLEVLENDVVLSHLYYSLGYQKRQSECKNNVKQGKIGADRNGTWGLRNLYSSPTSFPTLYSLDLNTSRGRRIATGYWSCFSHLSRRNLESRKATSAPGLLDCKGSPGH